MSTRTVRSRPSHIAPQTLRQAKAAFKKTGPRLSERELRQIERGAEQLRRAERLKEQERKKKTNERKREERERKEQEARKAIGIGLATQLAGFSHTQHRMKSAMEKFVTAGKPNSWAVKSTRLREPAQEKDLDDLWDQELLEELEVLSPVLVRQPKTEKATASHRKLSDPWDEDDMDDDTLLDALSGQSPGMRRNGGSQEQTIVPTQSRIGSDAAFSCSTSPHALFTHPDLDPWDGFLASNTQIAREIKTDEKAIPKLHEQAAVDFLCTQDFDFSAEDLKEFELARPAQEEQDTSITRCGGSHKDTDHLGRPRPSVSAKPAQVVVSNGTTTSSNADDRLLMPPPPPKLVTAITKQPTTTTPSSFCELGLCTQDVYQIVDDEIVLSDGD